MSTYKQYSKKEKLIRTWNLTFGNKSLIDNDIKTFDQEKKKRFNSTHYFKGARKLNLAEVDLDNGFGTLSFTIKDFSEEFIAYSYVNVLLSVPSAYDLSNAKENISQEFTNGTLEDGDIFVGKTQVITWWTRLGEDSWRLNVGITANIFYADVSEFGFSGNSINPITVKLELIILNGREYPLSQSGK